MADEEKIVEPDVSPYVASAPPVHGVARLRTFVRTYPKFTAFMLGQIVFTAIAAGTQLWFLTVIPIIVVLFVWKVTSYYGGGLD